MHRLMTQHSEKEKTQKKNKKMKDWFELKEKKTSAGEKREVTNGRDCEQRRRSREKAGKKEGELA